MLNEDFCLELLILSTCCDRHPKPVLTVLGIILSAFLRKEALISSMLGYRQQKQNANTLLDVGKRHASVKQDNSHLNLLEHVLPLSAGRVSASWYAVSKRVTVDMYL